MVIVPNSRIRLLKSPIELDERNQLTFSNVNAQTSYFLSLPYLEYDNCTYQRKDGVIRYETEPNGITYEDLLGYNYCMYQNTAYDNKWFYAFITECRYVNDGMTELKIETDVIETWKFEINYKPSFIEREHVSDDTLGLHTYPETLETGEYIESGATKYNGFGANAVVMCSSISIQTLDKPQGRFVSGLFAGNSYYYFGVVGEEHPTVYNQYMAVNDCFEYMSGKTENIQCLFMCPETILQYEDCYPRIGETYTWKELNPNRHTAVDSLSTSFEDPITLADFNCYRPGSIGSYTPRNNKVLCFPYTYLMLSNNNGANGVYHYEDFGYDPNDPTKVRFNVKGICCPGCSIRCYPKSYKGVEDNYTVGISAGKFPVCNWATDAYTNWLTQNSVNMGLSAAGTIMSAVSGVALTAGGNPILGVPMLLGSAADVGNHLKELYNKQFVPNECSGDVGSGDIAFSTQNNTFVFHQFQIKEEYARIIDNYFTMFGYKVNTLKTPAFETRSNWNYIKTRGLNITGDIPQEDMQKIKEIFDNGLTFWHNPSTFLDYSVSNSIV